MATKQQRDLAIKKLSRILKIASKKAIGSRLCNEVMFLTRFLTIKRIKLIRDNAINEAIQNNASTEAINRLQNFFPYIDSL